MKQPPKVILPKLKLDRCPECKVKAGQQHKLNCALLIKSHPIQSYPMELHSAMVVVSDRTKQR